MSTAAKAVEVPEAWRRIGFSGLFTQESAIDPSGIEKWREKAPCFLPDQNWLLLRVTDTDPPRAVLVRKDMAAVADTFFGGAS